MELPQTLEVKGIKVLTTRQLAEAYTTTQKVINNNFSRNKDKYILGKHYILIEGQEMKKLKASPQFEGELHYVSKVYFWTEKGALLHAKSLNTDKAWQVYDYLVDFYFRAKEKSTEIIKSQKPFNKVTMKNPILIFKVLTQLAEQNNMQIRSYDFKASPSLYSLRAVP